MNRFYDYMIKQEVFNNDELAIIREHETWACEYPTRFMASAFKVFAVITNHAHPGVTFSKYKKYDAAPINNLEFMKRGLEVFRVVFSHYVARHRGANVEFLRDGLLVQQGWLGKNSAENLIKEIEDFPLAVQKTEGINVAATVDRGMYPMINYCTMGKGLETQVLGAIGRLTSVDAKQKFFSNTFIQKVHNTPDGFAEGTLMDSEGKDIQKQIHADIFFPAVKFWYFPQEVKLENGPLNYVPRSCALTEPVLDFWYNESINALTGTFPKWKRIGHTEGSLRVSVKEVEQMGLEVKVVTVPGDTLIIGNVHGFHCRGPATVDSVRVAIHGSIRVENPFEV